MDMAPGQPEHVGQGGGVAPGQAEPVGQGGGVAGSGVSGGHTGCALCLKGTEAPGRCAPDVNVGGCVWIRDKPWLSLWPSSQHQRAA